MVDGDADRMLYWNQIVVAERVVASRLSNADRMDLVIEQIVSRLKLERPDSPLAWIKASLTLERAGTSKITAHLPQYRRSVDLFDKNKPKRPV